MPPSAMIGHACGVGRPRAVEDGADHRHADAGDHARRADRPGADADLDRVDAERDQVRGRLARRHVAGDQVHVGEPAPQLGRPCPSPSARARAPCRPRARPRARRPAPPPDPCVSLPTPTAAPTRRRPSASLRRERVLDHLLDVLDGDQPLQHVAGGRRRAASRPCGGGGSRAPRRASCRPAR